MLWLVVLALAGWVFVLTFQLGDLRAHIRGLEARIAELRDRLRDPASPTPAPPTTAAAPDAARAVAPEPDTVREAMAQAEAAAARVIAEPAPQPVHRLRPARDAEPEPEPAFAPPPRPPGPPARQVVRAWLEENGLAWAGGAALALGGLFLVTYAAQRGLFTPPFRIAAAVVTGLLLLAVSEWLKRRAAAPLPAALAAGAGAATLYGAAWASYWLYAFIGLAPAAILMAIISVGLLALAFRHGEPLAMLALFGGFVAPAVTGPQGWSAPALTGYLALMLATGFAVAAARRWGRAGVTTLVGAFLWGLAGFAAEDPARVTALATGPLVLAYAAVGWRRRRDGPDVTESGSRDVFAALPALALAAAALGVGAAWVAPQAPHGATAAAVGAGLLALLAGLGARRRLIPPLLQVLGYLPALGAALFAWPDPSAFTAWTGALLALVAAAGVLAATGGSASAPRLASASAAVVALLLAFAIRGAPIPPWSPEAATALLLFAGAVALARTSAAPARDLALAVWLWASGVAGVLALQQALAAPWLPLGAALLSLAAAVLHARLAWRGLAAVMVGGAVAALGALISPDLFDAVQDGDIVWWMLALVAAGTVALAYAGARLATRPDRPRESADAQSTAALVIGLAGVILLLRHAASAGAVHSSGFDLFVESGLRTLLLLVAGLTSAQAVRADSSVIGRWRGQALLGLGLLHGVAFNLLAFNPLAASWRPAIAGPPLLDSLALGFLAPAVVLGFATWRKVSVNRALLATSAAAAGAFATVWALFEIRRLFQGPSLHGGFEAIGRAEAAAYAVLALVVARALVWVGERASQRAWTVASLSGGFVRAGQAAGWTALALAVLVFGHGASPWWGPIDRPLAGLGASVLLLGLYGLGVVTTGVLARTAALGPHLPRAATLTAVAVAFAGLNIALRMVFHGYDLRPLPQDLSLETWAFSAMWGVFGFALLVYGAARRSSDLRAAGLAVLLATLAKIFLFDMARLDGVVRAGSFLAVGALLLAAAVIVRRLGGEAALPFGLGRRREAEAPEA